MDAVDVPSALIVRVAPDVEVARIA